MGGIKELQCMIMEMDDVRGRLLRFSIDCWKSCVSSARNCLSGTFFRHSVNASLRGFTTLGSNFKVIHTGLGGRIMAASRY